MTIRSFCARGATAVIAGVALLAAAPSANAVTSTPTSDLSFKMQAQEKDQWCWDASGTSVAEFWGHDITQTKFCQIAHNESGSDCQNKEGYLSDQQRVYRSLNFSNAGTYSDNGQTLSMQQIQQQIDAGQPIGTRIGWTSGGGHMHVIYGYSGSKVSYGDPWPQNNRYNSMDYSSYKSNSKFNWTHTVYNVKG